jgi:hypothetical protein
MPNFSPPISVRRGSHEAQLLGPKPQAWPVMRHQVRAVINVDSGTKSPLR